MQVAWEIQLVTMHEEISVPSPGNNICGLCFASVCAFLQVIGLLTLVQAVVMEFKEEEKLEVPARRREEEVSTSSLSLQVLWFLPGIIME